MSTKTPIKESQLWAWVSRGSFLLLAHSICSIVLSLTIVFVLDGYNAIDSLTPRLSNRKLRLRVADITTLVSMGLVINRFFTASWTAIAIWRAACILQRSKSGLSEPSLAFMQNYKLPPWVKYPFQWPQGISSWVILLILLFILPQQFIAPIISGAVNWNPVFVSGSAKISINSTSPMSSISSWDEFPGHGSSTLAARQQRLARAQGLASLAWSDSSTTFKNGTSSVGNGCRHVISDDGFAKNSTLLDSVVPCIRIENIDWAISDSEISSSAADDYFSLSSSLLSIVNVSLVYHSDPGQAALFNPNFLWNLSDVNFPAPTLVSGTQILAISIAHNGRTTNNCTSMPTSIFGDVNNGPRYLHPSNDACYAFANITFTAGVTHSPVSKYLLSNVVEDQTPIDQVVFEPDPWAQIAMWLLPDLMSQIAFANSSQMPAWQNIDAYTENIIRQAYLAAWDSLHEAYDNITITHTVNSIAVPAVSMIQGSVSKIRVFIWLGVSLLLFVSGLLLNLLPFVVPKSSENVIEEIIEAENSGAMGLLHEGIGAAGQEVQLNI